MKFSINGIEVEPVESMTLGEAWDFTRISGKTLNDIDDVMGDPGALVAFVYISGRRAIPALTVEDVKDLDLATLIIEDDDDADEAGDDAPLGEAAAAPPAPKRARRDSAK